MNDKSKVELAEDQATQDGEGVVETPDLDLVGIADQIRVPVNTYALIQGGGTLHVKWAVTVRRCEIEESKAYVEAVKKSPNEEGYKTDIDVARELIVDWHMLKTTKKKKVPYTDINLQGLFKIPEYKQSLVDAIFMVMSGGAKKRALMG